jgi:hypothetical protein
MGALTQLPEWPCPEPWCDTVCVGDTLGGAAMKLYEHGQDVHGVAVAMCAESAPVGDGWCVLPAEHTPLARESHRPDDMEPVSLRRGHPGSTPSEAVEAPQGQLSSS